LVRKSVALIRDENNNAVYCCNMPDITKQKNAEEALQRSEEKFRSLFDLSGAARR
jgi:PAS domain-containing protein